MTGSSRWIRMWAAGGLVLGLALPGCGDLDGVALVAVESDSPVPVLQLGRDLPSVPTLVARWGGGLPLESVLDQWENSWVLPEDEGERVRMESIQALSLLLLPHLPEGELERSIGQVDGAVRALEAALEGRDLEALGGPVSQAVSAAHRASTALGAGDSAEALRWALASSDHLRKATPEVLARTLILEVEAELQRLWDSPQGPGHSELTLGAAEAARAEARVRRLLAGAQEAMNAEDFPRALRRAWYAMGLIESLRSGGTEPGPVRDPWEGR